MVRNIRPIWIMIYFNWLIIIFVIVITSDKNFVFIINITLYIPKIDDFIEILTEMKDFVDINFSEYFKSIREEKNLEKVTKSLYIFLTTPGEVIKYVQWNSSGNRVHHYNAKILNLFYPELQQTNTKTVIKNKRIVNWFEKV